MMIYTVKTKNTKYKDPNRKLQPNSHEQQIKYIFLAFKDRGIQYQLHKFDGSSEFKGVLKQELGKSLKTDQPFGGKPTKLEFDELSDVKFHKLQQNGTLKPHINKYHIKVCIYMGLSWYLSF